MFAIIAATFVVLALPMRHADRPRTLRAGLHASVNREAYATSWHYLPGQTHERRMDHLLNLWDRNGMRHYAARHLQSR